MPVISRNKVLGVVIGYLVIVLVALPLTLINLKKPQQTASNAAASTTLSLSPATSQKNTGETFPIDIMMNPGSNIVSLVTLDILYDASKLAPADTTPFQAYNPVDPTPALRNVLEGPVFSPGRIRVKISAGSSPNLAVSMPSKIATLSFKAIGSTSGSSTQVQFGTANSVLSIGPNDSATENVLASTQPASVQISGANLPTPTTGGVGGPPTSVPTQPVPTDTPIPTSAIPTPSCTPQPTVCNEDSTLPACTPPAGGFCTEQPTPTTGPAPTTGPISCTNTEPTDIIVILDASGSMKGEKIGNAKTSAKSFVNLLSNTTTNRVGIITFSKTAKIVAPLQNNYPAVAQAIDGITLGSSTCTKCGIDEADNLLRASGRADAKKVVILLTDGIANLGGAPGTDKRIAAEQAALNSLRNAKTPGIVMYTIGMGEDVNPTFLQQLAQTSGGIYYFAATPVQIDDSFTAIYTALSDALCNIQTTPSAGITVPPGTTTGGAFNSVTLIMVLLLLLPLLLVFGHVLF